MGKSEKMMKSYTLIIIGCVSIGSAAISAACKAGFAAGLLGHPYR